MPDRHVGRRPENALAGLTDTANALAGIGSFEGILELAPQLALWVVPSAKRAELQVTRPRCTRATTSRADAVPGCGLTSVPSHAAVLCVEIALDDDTPRGGLTLYAGRSAGFDEADSLTAVLLTSQIRDALERVDAWETTAQLQVAVVTNRDIGVAIGILMATQQLSPAEAFAVLRTTSQHSNRQLAEVAENVRRPYSGEPEPVREALWVGSTGEGTDHGPPGKPARQPRAVVGTIAHGRGRRARVAAAAVPDRAAGWVSAELDD